MINSCSIVVKISVLNSLRYKMIAYEEMVSHQKFGYSRGKEILEKISRPRFFSAFEISHSFLRAKQVGKVFFYFMEACIWSLWRTNF